jgi:hypothetical protein
MGSGNTAPSFLTSAVDGVERLDSRPGNFTPGETGCIVYCIGGWRGSIGGLDVMENIEIVCAIQVSNPVSSVVQSVVRWHIYVMY